MVRGYAQPVDIERFGARALQYMHARKPEMGSPPIGSFTNYNTWMIKYFLKLNGGFAAITGGQIRFSPHRDGI